MKCQLDAIR